MLLVLIAVVIDFSEKIDNFIQSSATFSQIIIEYYANFIPHIAALLAPLFILVSVVFFTSQLATRSEIIAMTSGGVSFYRLMVPYLISAAILGGIQFYSNHYWIPNANKVRVVFEDEMLAKWKPSSKVGIHRKLDDSTYLYMSKYLLNDNRGLKATVETFEDGELKTKLAAAEMRWDTVQENWLFTSYFSREFEAEGEIFERGDTIRLDLNIVPDDFQRKLSSKEMMTTPELKSFITELKATGQEYVEFYQLELYRRTSSVGSIFILTIIGLAIASRKIRGGLGIHIMAAIVTGALFEMTMKFSTTFTTNAGFPPVLGVWTPNIIFGVVALILIRFAQK